VHSLVFAQKLRPGVAIDMWIAAVRAFGASAGTADLTVEAFQAEVEPDTAGVGAAIADSLVVAASASGGIAADSHVELAGTRLAAVEEHTEGIGRSHRPAAASYIAGPWLRMFRVGAITGS
jgi:hypothetical protein